MCKALIIGAGGVGTVVTQKIAANPVFTDVMLAVPNPNATPLRPPSAATA